MTPSTCVRRREIAMPLPDSDTLAGLEYAGEFGELSWLRDD